MNCTIQVILMAPDSCHCLSSWNLIGIEPDSDYVLIVGDFNIQMGRIFPEQSELSGQFARKQNKTKFIYSEIIFIVSFRRVRIETRCHYFQITSRK